MKELERRAYAPSDDGVTLFVELRGEGEDELPVIRGYAAVFNRKSVDLGGFQEVVIPGAFDRALREKHDVRALFNHDPDVVLGRVKSGTLSMEVDDRGLKVEIQPPDTQAARDLVTSIRRKDVDGMSFAFYTLRDAWPEEEGRKGLPLRELRDLELVDVSPVSFPAYRQTTVSARALDHVKGLAPDPELGDDGAAERAAREIRLRRMRFRA